MTVQSGVSESNDSAERQKREALRRAYVRAYRDAYGRPAARSSVAAAGIGADPELLVSPALLAAHNRVGLCRRAGDTNIIAYGEDDPNGFGPALQVAADDAPTLLDSLVSLLQRLELDYVGIMSPVFRVRRGPHGELVDIATGEEDKSVSGRIDEAWIHLQLASGADAEKLAEVQRLLPSVFNEAHQVARDEDAMETRLRELADVFDTGISQRCPVADRYEIGGLLRWLLDGHFTLIGYQRSLVSGGRVSLDESSRLGMLRLRQDVFPQLTNSDDLLVIMQATVPSYQRGGVYPYVIVIRESPADSNDRDREANMATREIDGAKERHTREVSTGDGAIVHRFVGMFTVAASNANVLEIPIVSGRVESALQKSSQGMTSVSRQLLLDVLQTVPRPELFALDDDQLLAVAQAVAELNVHSGARLFVHADQLGNFVSCLVYLPRDRYNPATRLLMQDILVREFGGAEIDYSARINESPWAILHFTIRMPVAWRTKDIASLDDNRRRIEALLTEAAWSWTDALLGVAHLGGVGQQEAGHYADAFQETYKQVVPPADAVGDIGIIEELHDNSVRLVLLQDQSGVPAQLNWYFGGQSASLSQLVPMLQSMGVTVLEERPFTVRRPDGLPVWIYQFKISPHVTMSNELPAGQFDDIAQRFANAVTAVWYGHAEVDRFNELVLRAGLSWQQAAVLRLYAKYLRQLGFPYSQAHIESIVNDNPHTARSLVVLFEALFDPTATDSGKPRAQAAAAAVTRDIDELVSLDTDRVLRAFASMIEATLRTNYFVIDEGSARQQGVLSFKLNTQLIDEAPPPRPKFEIFVYSSRVEGVHLRFGHVARGGLRWSDRREDFRTEVLGLVKAQAVKNAVIVPVGAKGGFIVKRPPASADGAAPDRDALWREGVACYKLFIGGLLDITDNVDQDSDVVSTPDRVVRRDHDDAYLVVAADKGTAAFSDIANDVARSYGFWLGDAFASGGSVGYDHKAMGITAKGAWESVKRHFREIGIDSQTDDFTVVGVGDMSGDVFGNGMLLSKHIRLLAAFDHRHIFLDPDPDATRSWGERKRLFDLPRSSWADYDASLISTGGGVYSREQKSIPISPQIREALQLPSGVTEMTPPELIRGVLRAPVDLLFNGGIGTYIKAESESNSDVGDRSNDAVRVNGKQVRARVIGEGGNLGVTALGRTEYDLGGGRVNTDALDNSAGVDCSDHEVNIKILVDSLVVAGKLDAAERTGLLESMTGEVEQLVLANNAEQNDVMGTSRPRTAALLPLYARQISDLVKARGLNRELEGLPSVKELRRRNEQGLGLTSPELATLMAHVKLALKDQLLATDLPDQETFAGRLPGYFPAALRDNFSAEVKRHRLRREIVTTMLVNDLIGSGGITFAYQLMEDSGVGPVDTARTFAATDAIFGITDIWRQVRTLGATGDVPVAVTDNMMLQLRRLLDRASRWLLNYRRSLWPWEPKSTGSDPRSRPWSRGSPGGCAATIGRSYSTRPKTWSHTVWAKISPSGSRRRCTATASSISSTSPTLQTLIQSRPLIPITR